MRLRALIVASLTAVGFSLVSVPAHAAQGFVVSHSEYGRAAGKVWFTGKRTVKAEFSLWNSKCGVSAVTIRYRFTYANGGVQLSRPYRRHARSACRTRVASFYRVDTRQRIKSVQIQLLWRGSDSSPWLIAGRSNEKYNPNAS